jgi:predicted tellurium resistance membrane protein TerC
MDLLALFSDPAAWISLLTLSAMEIVLGIDNIVFLSLMVGKLPPRQQPAARTVGLVLALGMRLGLLLAISWVMGLTAPLFAVVGKAFSGRDLILLGGGLFLIAKSTHEMFDRLEGEAHDPRAARAPKESRSAFALVLVQIIALDLVFSLDSVITAVGMAQHIPIMVAAMVIAMVVMLVFARSIGDFVHRHPSMKVLALSFLLLIGAMLVADGMGHHIPKGYIYFAMAFSLGVELVNMKLRARQSPVQLHERHLPLEPKA